MILLASPLSPAYDSLQMSSKCCNRLSKSTALNFIWGLCYSLGTASSNALALHDFQSRPEGICTVVFDRHLDQTDSVLMAIFLLAIPTFVVYFTGRMIGMERAKLGNLSAQLAKLTAGLKKSPETQIWSYDPSELATAKASEDLDDETKYGGFYCFSARSYYNTTLVFGWFSVVAVGFVFFGGNALSVAAGIKAAGGNNKTAGSI